MTKNFLFSADPQIEDLWYHEDMDQEDDEIHFIAIVECPDCDITVISDPEYMSVFLGFGDIWGISLCGYCERPISANISKEFAIELTELGVKAFSWETGSEIGAVGVSNFDEKC